MRHTPDFARALAPLAAAALLCLAIPTCAHATPGAPDPTFASGGIFSDGFGTTGQDSGSELLSVSLAPGGDIDAVGTDDDLDEREVLAVRLNEHGALDPTFNSDGFIITPFKEKTEHQITLQGAEPELVQANGSIIAGGNRLLGRLTPTGLLDPDFEHATDHIDIKAIAALPNGDLLAAGTQEGPEGPNGNFPPAIERLLPNGARDESFGEKGVVKLLLHTGTVSQEQARVALALPDGKILLAGSGHSTTGEEKREEFVWLARVNSDGSLDGSFGSSGIDYLASSGPEAALAREPSGRLVLFGEGRTSSPGPFSEPSGWQTIAWGFSEQGTPDRGFGSNGSTALPSSNPEPSNYVAAATADSSGRLFVAVNQVKLNNYRALPYVARLSPTGQLEAAYGQGGLALGPELGFFGAVTVDPAGRTIVAGTGIGGSLIERFEGDRPPSAASSPTTTASKGASGALPMRLAVHCAPLIERHPKKGHSRRTLQLRCGAQIAHLKGRWSKLEVMLKHGSVTVARISSRHVRRTAYLEFRLPLPHVHVTCRATAILRRGRHHVLRLSTTIAVPARR